MVTIAKEFGISDRGLAKTLRAARSAGAAAWLLGQAFFAVA
jgi:hypothetical protein